MQDVPCYIQPMVQARAVTASSCFRARRPIPPPPAELDALHREAAARCWAPARSSAGRTGLAQLVYRDYADGAAALRRLKGVFDPHGSSTPASFCF
jgi:hypothetical protein